jgi:SnoaL-like protein
VDDAARLELCRVSYECWSTGDVERIVAIYDPECEWVMGEVGAALGQDCYRGHQGLRRFMSDVLTFFDDYRAEIVEARAHGERLLVRGWISGRTAAFGDISQYVAQVIEFGDRCVLRVTQTDDPPPGWDGARPLP